MSFDEWSNNKYKKKKKQSFDEWSNEKYGVENITPVRTTISAKSGNVTDIGPVRTSPSAAQTTRKSLFDDGYDFGDITRTILGSREAKSAIEKHKKRKNNSVKDFLGGYLTKGAFEDGYDKKDLSKTVLGSQGDVIENIHTGMVDMPEKIIDAFAQLVPYISQAQFDQSGGYYNLEASKIQNKAVEEMKKGSAEFVAKDLYDAEEVGKKVSPFLSPAAAISHIGSKILGVEDYDDVSVFDEKTDEIAQSAGQLGATAVASAAGVPWWLVSGATSFGGQAETALNEGASFDEATFSAAVSAGAEVLSEKISGGIKFGGKTLDDVLTKKLASGISNKVVRSLAKIGLDSAGEAFEEIVSGVMSNLGTAIYKEEDVSDILFSEEAVQEYIDSAIGGLILGGGSSVGNAIKGKISGVDPVTELTQSEQAVVDKVYNDEIAKAEKDGKKLTGKEKSKIYDRVLNNLEKGYIDIDTIESILGGETYNKYKETADREDALQNEFNALNKMKQGDMTGEQLDRRAELKQQLEELKGNSQRSQLKSQLNNEVMGLVKGSKLTESYNEKTRRSQHYEADLTQYNEKQRATIQKAIDSGILNNSNRTHEFVDLLANISADKGVLFDFINNERLKNSSFAVKGKTVNGYKTDDGNVALNIDSSKSLNSVVGHEITHVLEGTELYSTLQEAAKQYAEAKGEYATRLQSLRELYTGVYKGKDFDARLQEELTADIIGDYLFTDSDFINNLSTEQPGLFKKIHNEIKYLCKVATAGSNEARALEKVKKTFEDAWKQNGTAQKNTTDEGGVKYALKDIKIPTREELENKKPVKVIDISEAKTQGTYKERRNKINDSIEEIISKPYYNSDTQTFIFLTEKSYSHSFSNNLGDDLGEFQINAIEHMPEFIENAIFTHAEDKTHGNDYANGSYTFFAAAKTDKIQPVKLKVAEIEYKGQDLPKNVKKYFDENPQDFASVYDTVILEVEEIEKSSFGSVKDIDQDGLFNNPNELSEISVADLLNLVKGDARRYIPKQYSLSEVDNKYIDAVNRGDNATAQLLVKESAEKAGYTDVLYHGTKQFGFTEFDTSKSDDKISFFVAGSDDIAQTYSGKYGSKTISSIESVDNLSIEDVVDKLTEEAKNDYEDMQNEYEIMHKEDVNALIQEVNSGVEKLQGIVEQKIKGYADKLATDFDDKDFKTHKQLVELNEILDNYQYEYMSTPIYMLLHHTDAFRDDGINQTEIAELETNIRLMNKLVSTDTRNGVVVNKQLGDYGLSILTFDEARTELKNKLSSGNYALFGKPGKQFVVDCKGSNWNDITYYEDIPEELKSFYPNGLWRRGTTRDVVQYAKSLGYDSVKFENVVDNGGRGENVGAGDVYAYFNPNDLKSADPVTYDEDGNIIPLSERFKEDNNDIRYSLSEQGSQPSEHGDYNVHGEDIAFADFPIRNDINPKVTDDFEGVPIREDISKAPQKKSVDVAHGGDVEDLVRDDLPVKPQASSDDVPANNTLPDEEKVIGNDNLAGRRAQLNDWYENRKAELHEELDDKNAYISNKAKGLYDELSDLRKGGVRASSELGYFLDLGFKWSELKSTLLQVSKWPGEVVRPDSNVESVVREAIGREYEDRLYDFDDLNTEYEKKLKALENPENAPIQTVKERLTAKLDNTRKELLMNQRSRDESIVNFDNEISNLQAEYDSKRDKNTKVANNILRRIERMRRMKNDVDADYSKRISDLEARRDKLTEELRTGESQTEQGAMRKELHQSKIDNIKKSFAVKGFNLDEVLLKAKNLSTSKTVNNTPQRVMEKALGYEEGQALADETVNIVAQNETEGIKWLNKYTNRKKGLLSQISKQYNIKPGSKESAAAQMYAEGFYVDENNNIVKYWDEELEIDFPEATVRENIKGLAKDPRIRQIYDETLKLINESRSRNAYPEIQRLDNYFLHFRAMEDTFSRLGVPFNPKDIQSKDLPTDLSGVTANLKPGQPYFASAKHREGKRTSFDLLGGLEKYLTSAKNQIYHIDDIQTLRALRNYIADNFGQAKGLESIDNLSEPEAQEKIKDVFNSHLSTFAQFLNEEANVIAGKTALADRAVEGIGGRRGITFLNDVNKQVGSNSVGFNFSSPFTNLIPVVQTFAKTQKRDFVKAFAQTVSNKLKSIHGKSDGFAENSPVIIRRKGAERFYRTPVQKINDSGYWLMGAIDDISTELIARTKYNEFTRKGMDSQQAHFETDKWVSRLMGDRSLGQMPQIFNSKMLGLITKFQLEVRIQLDSQFYDTIQEAKISNKHIEDGLQRNARIAAKVSSTFFQLAILQHLFGIGFESVTGHNPAFDIIDVLIKTFGFDDDEDDEDTALDNIEEGFFALLEDMPYASTLTGGRIPISSALPIKQLINGADENGKEVSRVETLLEAAPYYILPTGYGQLKKTVEGLKMFDDDLPIAGSYTDSGDLRFPVEDTFWNKLQAAVFGQYASENAQLYFDEGYKPLNEKQIQEYKDLEIPIADYWKYREGLKGLETLNEKGEYIGELNLPVRKKNILINNIADREKPIDYTDYNKYSSFEEFDFATRYPEKYAVLQEQGISVSDYKENYEESAFMYTDDYSWASQNPEKYTLSKAITSDVMEYKQYTSDLDSLEADKDSNGKSISGSLKTKQKEYIWGLDIDEGAKYILFKSEYKSDDTYNYEIVDYLNSRDDISRSEMITILEQLGAKVDSEGYIDWD